VTVAARLAAAAQRLAQVSDTPRLDARLLARHLLGVGDTWLIAHGHASLAPAQATAFDALIERRAAGEPIAYLTGEREFYGRNFHVTPDTLIPRPETEHLIEAALARLPATGAHDGLDLGTGSGCIAITLKLERPTWRIAAVEAASGALAVAQENGSRLHADIEWLPGDLFAPVAGRRFDLIVSNPPYVADADPHLNQGDVRFEPRSALASGADGLDLIRRLVQSAPAHLNPGGWLMFEHGWDQADACAALLGSAGFAQHFLVRDLAGHARISGGQKDD